jgi:hypothetical protein
MNIEELISTPPCSEAVELRKVAGHGMMLAFTSCIFGVDIRLVRYAIAIRLIGSTTTIGLSVLSFVVWM